MPSGTNRSKKYHTSPFLPSDSVTKTTVISPGVRVSCYWCGRTSSKKYNESPVVTARLSDYNTLIYTNIMIVQVGVSGAWMVVLAVICRPNHPLSQNDFVTKLIISIYL